MEHNEQEKRQKNHNLRPNVLKAGDLLNHFRGNGHDLLFKARFLGSFCCCLYSETEMVWKTSGQFTADLIAVKCFICDNQTEDPCSFAGRPDVATVERDIAADFVNLLQVKNQPHVVATVLCASMPSIMVHIGINETIVDAFFTLFSEGNEFAVIKSIHKVMPFFFQPIPGTKPQGWDPVMILSVLEKRFRHLLVSIPRITGDSITRAFTEIETIAEMASLAEKELMLEILFFLIRVIWANGDIISVFINNQLNLLGRLKKSDRLTIFIENEAFFYNKMLEHLVVEMKQNPKLKGHKKFWEILQQFVSNDERSVNLNNAIPLIISQLCIIGSDEAERLLKGIIQEGNMDSLSQVLTGPVFIEVLKNFVRRLDVEGLDKSFEFMSKVSGISVEGLFKLSRHVLFQVLVMFHSHQENVLHCLSLYATFESNGVRRYDFRDRQKFVDYLVSSLHIRGFLVNLSRCLMNPSYGANKVESLRSLGDIISLVGPLHVPIYQINLNSLLSSAAKYALEEEMKTLVIVYESYLKNLRYPDIEANLSAICKDLLPLYDQEPRKTALLYEMLIVNNATKLGDKVREIHFLPKTEELKRVNDIIDCAAKDAISSNASEAEVFKTELQRLLYACSSRENADLKKLHYQKMRDYLKGNITILRELCLPQNEDPVDPVIQQTINTMLSDSRVGHPEVRLAIAECIGEIGAIDPGRFEKTPLSLKQDISEPLYEMPEFEVALLKRLAFLVEAAKDMLNQNIFHYVLQELLKQFDVSDTSGHVWKSLPENVRDICTPLLTSKYALTQKIIEEEDVEPPIFSLEIKYEKWVSRWAISLIKLIKVTKTRSMFTACIAGMVFEHTLAQFLLPYILMSALRDATESEKKKYIANEVHAVIYYAAPGTDYKSYPQSSQIESKVTVTSVSLCQVQHLCAQAIFSLLDSMNVLVHKTRVKMLQKQSKIQGSIIRRADEEEALGQVTAFVAEIPKSTLASLAYGCQAYARAFLYLEQFLRDKKFHQNEVELQLGLLQKLYVALDEPDGVDGVIAKRRSIPSLMDSILAHEATGQLQDAFACCEKAVTQYPDNIDYSKMLLRCLMSLDQPSTAFTYSDGLISQKNEWKEHITPYMIEAAWKLSKWKDLTHLLKDKQLTDREFNINLGFGKLFVAIVNTEKEDFCRSLAAVREKEMNPIAAAAAESGAYIRGYPHFVRLHMISDLEKAANNFYDRKFDSKADGRESLLKEWKDRNQTVQSSLRFQEPVLNLQRVLMNLKREKFVPQLVKSWLSSAKLARNNGNLQRAYNCLLEVKNIFQSYSECDSDFMLIGDFFIENAKHGWAKGDQESKESAIKELFKGIDKHFADHGNIEQSPNHSVLSKSLSGTKQTAWARVLLLLAKYTEQSSNMESNSLKEMYKKVVQLDPNSEKSHFCLAKFYDRLLGPTEKAEQRAILMYKLSQHFHEALRCGIKHVYESLPRLLSVWFDLGSKIVVLKKKVEESVRRRREEKELMIAEYQDYKEAFINITNKYIRTLKHIPPYLLFTAFSQLISRICHSEVTICETLTELIAHLLKEYPHQSMWMIVGVLLNKAKNTPRSQQCHRIINEAAKMEPRLTKFFSDAQKLAQSLINLCSYVPRDNTVNTFNLIDAVPNIVSLFENQQMSDIMIPFRSFMSVHLPQKNKPESPVVPFPSEGVYIRKFHPTVLLLASMQKPKKIVIEGSDGKQYVMMCKPKDDLRKDKRTMEFNNLVNRHLRRDPETRKRQLHIRTYTVIPLNHDCGLLEWVPNLNDIRGILAKMYRLLNNFDIRNKHLNQVYPDKALTPDASAKKFQTHVIPNYNPPVFGEYLIRSFPDPTSWYLARMSYVRTCAVMSMVGYIIGLGDRHLENILLDTSCGDVVHVDFDCIFNKGEELEIPEKVPFRLTHNMVDAMGPTGYEGLYRKTCEATLRVMREQTDALMSVLKPFVYDPLLEWKEDRNKTGNRLVNPAFMRGNSRGDNDTETVETTNEQAVKHVSEIENRLKGRLKRGNKPITLPLSVSGQVNFLIDEATDPKNLSKMYFGWSSFL